MTGDAFDRLLYTDCRAGAGRGGGGGFQVQAQSLGVDSAQAKMAVGWLLYEAQTAWIVDGRPVDKFPLGFAHAAEAGYGTAQSCYLGTEATGARQGNHLTDCLLTEDSDLYGPTRPAQLWRSPLWRAEPWDSTDCPQYEDTPPLGPLTVDAVAEWLSAHPDRPLLLSRLVSVLEDPVGRHVVITSSGPDEALLWIAAATLLLPTRAALQVSFKVFSASLQRASHRIVGVPSELGSQVFPGREGSAFVLDADEPSSGDRDVSERARFWVGLLGSAEDPYDVVDAVELAEVMAAGSKAAVADARTTAWAVTVPDSPVEGPAAMFRWLSGADPKLQHEHGPTVVRRILSSEADAATLRWIDTAAASDRIGMDKPMIRRALLTAEIAEARAGGTAPAEPLSNVNADEHDRRDAESELTSAIALASDSDVQVELLLRLSWRHGIKPQPEPLSDRLRAFALAWIDNPDSDYRPDNWALREEIVDCVYGELQLRLSSGGLPAVGKVLARLWPQLVRRPRDLSDLLSCYVAAAALWAVPADQRQPRLASLLEHAEMSRNPEAAFRRLQQALAEWQALGPTEALLLICALPPTVPVAQAVLDVAVPEIQHRIGRLTALILDALAVLHGRGLASDEPPYGDLLSADRNVLGFIQATRTAKFREDLAWGRRWLSRLERTDPAVIRVRLAAILQACLDFPQPGLGSAVIKVLPGPVGAEFVDMWGRELTGSQRTRAAVEGFCWHDDGPPRDIRSAIADTFADLAARLEPGDRDLLYEQVLTAIGTERAAAWGALLGYREARQWRVRRKDGS